MHEDWRAERDRALLTLETAKSTRDRTHAAQTIVQLALEDAARRPELSALLPRLLADPLDRVRRAAVALAALLLSPEEAERFFADRLRDPAEEVRVEAVGQLADLVRPSARGLLASALEDPVFSVRFEAARGMAALAHAAGLEVLVQALDDDHLRFRALGALAELGDERAVPAIERVHARWLLPAFERTQAAGALARLGRQDAAKWLSDRARKRRGADRPLAVELLGEVKAPGAKAQLLAILEDPKDPCRGAAARGLGRLGDADAVPRLLALFEEPGVSDDVRLDAAEGLCLLSANEAVAKVESLSQDLEPELRAELRLMLEEYR